MSKILITGANGQLGTELRNMLDERKIDYLATGMDDLDITDKNAVLEYFEKYKPTVIIHCAAYTAVDYAEEEDKELNWQVNAVGTGHIAKAAKENDATLIYISTDYVFDGESSAEYKVDSPTNPRNEYGRAKLAGELAVQKICKKYYIVRTSWVFGEYGNNFVYTMLKLAETHEKLTVVSDQIGRPTWTKTLADFILFLEKDKPEFGIYHLSNDNVASWYDFANEILKDKKIEVKPVMSEEYPQKAYRPRKTVMDLSKTKELGYEINDWRYAVNKFLADIEMVKE